MYHVPVYFGSEIFLRFFCEIYFAKVSPCHIFLLSMWLICKNNFLWKEFWNIFAKLFHRQNKWVYTIFWGMIKIISDPLLNYLYDALWIFLIFQCIRYIINNIGNILSTFLQEFIGEELISANGDFFRKFANIKITNINNYVHTPI